MTYSIIDDTFRLEKKLILILGFVFITCMIPETRGKTDQQIQEQMQSNQSDKLNQEPKLSNSDQKLVHRSPV